MLLTLLTWVLLLYMTIPFEIFTPREKLVDGYAVNPLARAIKIALLLSGFFFILWRSKIAKMLFNQLNRFFVVFLFLVPASYLWSISPVDTLARDVSIMSEVTVCAAFCLASWNRERFQSVVRPCVTLILLGSLVFGLVSPELAIEHGIGTLKDAWHGLTLQKNEFGQLGSFGVLFWLHAGLAGETKPWKSLLFGTLAMVCVVLSRSSTSLLSTVFSMILLLMLLRSPKGLRRYMPYIVALFAGTVLTYALAVLRLVPGLSLLLEPIAAITGKDTTFSNRSTIWEIIKEHIQLHPFLGTGYGAYWVGPVPSSPSYTFLGRMFFYPSESHNGYLEIVNDLGFVGMIVLFGYLIVYVRQSLQLMRFDRAQGALFLSLFFEQAIMNLSESTWLVVNSAFLFTIMTLATFALARSLLQLKVEVPGPPRVAAVRR